MNDMSELHFEAARVAAPRYKEDPSLEDDMSSFKKQIYVCFQNLIEYRAHLVHKYSEAAFDTDFYECFNENEVVVISDYKMKILASKHRESQEGMFMCLLFC